MPTLGSLDQGVTCPRGDNRALLPDNLGPGSRGAHQAMLRTETPGAATAEPHPEMLAEMTEQEARAEGWLQRPGEARCPVPLRSVHAYAGLSLVGHLPQQSPDHVPPGARWLGECQTALLPVVIMEIKIFVSSQALPPVTLSCSARPGATPRENPTLFPPGWLLVPTSGVRER